MLYLGPNPAMGFTGGEKTYRDFKNLSKIALHPLRFIA